MRCKVNKKLLPAIKACAVALMLTLACGSGAYGAENSGMISVEDFYSKDSSSSYNQHFLTTRLRFDSNKIRSVYGFHFDGRLRNDLKSTGSKSSAKNDRVETVYGDYTSSKLYLSVGRLYPKELYLERVDGLNLVIQRKNSGYGFFGGLKPDPNTEAFNTSYTAGGAYAFFRNDKLNSAIALVHNGYKGGTDRQYVYGQASYNPNEKVSVYSTVTADLDQKKKKKPKLTNAIAELTYRPDFKKSFTIGYSQFRAYKLYKSMPDVEDNRQQSFYAGTSYRFFEKYTAYARAEYQTMYYPSIEKKFSKGKSARVGLNGDNLLNTGVSVDLSASITDSFGSKHNVFAVEASRLNWEKLQTVLNVSYLQNQYGFVNSENIWTYGASAYYFPNRNWNFSFTFDREQGKTYTADRVLTRVTFKF